MENKFFIATVLCICGLFQNFSAQTNNGVSQTSSKDAFPLVHKGVAASFYIDTLDAEVVRIALRAFRKDLNMVTGAKPAPIYKNKQEFDDYPIIAGTLGKSALIDRLATEGKINTSQVKDKWETYLITVLDKPFKGVKKALVIAGSDRRGTAYGIFELSRLIGISPWVWWADVIPPKQEDLYLNLSSAVFGPPSVQYRGIFLNDEDWGLKPWASKLWDTDIKDIGPRTYERIFELMLRLRANYLWPAMHDCTKAFYFYPENPKLADKFAIVVGSSHCEPILRNNVFEWKENYIFEYNAYPGEWRYDLNKPQIYKYWDDRAKQSSKYESVYTIGMRGIHDGSMPGPKDINEKLKLLDTVIRDQRGILTRHLGRPISEIPQIFCPYKEVLTLYQKGLNLPEDVTIVWADDNHGYIRQLSTPEEQKRSGGSGVYYHLSYWGSPHDYLWLSSISPTLVSFEMTKAYNYGAKRLWIFNAGDIKPAEMEIEFAMDLAWNVNKWTPQTAHNYAKEWAVRTFGNEFADSIAFIKSIYYQLAQAGKPEHLGVVSFSHKEMLERIDSYEKIASVAERMYQVMPDRLKDAFFQLIYYPVYGAKFMNKKIFYARMSIDLAAKKDTLALEYTVKSIDAYDRIQYLTKQYNEEIAKGKWNGMMSSHPRNLEVFKMPKVATEEMFKDSLQKLGNTDSIPIGKPDPDIIKAKVTSEIQDKEGKIFIKASSFSKKSDGKEGYIATIPGIGMDGEGISFLPFTSVSVSASYITKAPYVEFNVDLNPGNHEINVKCLPTHIIHKGLEVRYAISVNDDSIQIVNIASPAESAVWKKNVLRGYSMGKTKHNISSAGKAAVRIYLPDSGVVINRIEIE